MKCIKENSEEVRFRARKGKKDRYKAHAERRGKSLTGLIVDLLEQNIKTLITRKRSDTLED